MNSVLCVIQLNFQRKVGVMYCRAGQSSEEDMYNNESSGPAFEEFLDLLGERVRLKGWEKYRAQLDTKSELTSEHTPHPHPRLGSYLLRYLKGIDAPFKAQDSCYGDSCNLTNACKIVAADDQRAFFSSLSSTVFECSTLTC